MVIVDLRYIMNGIAPKKEARKLFNQSIEYYDKIYSFKNYKQEAEYILKTLDAKGFKEETILLDVACGTGEHIDHLKMKYKVEGLDISEQFIKIAAEKNPEVIFHIGDMRTFDLYNKYDVIICLFSSIGYLTTLQEIEKTISRMKSHLKDKGILLIEPWFTPDQWHVGSLYMNILDNPERKIVRMSTSLRIDNLSIVNMHHLIGNAEGTTHFVEQHKLGLYTRKEMEEAFRANNLSVEYDEEGPSGRGLYLASYN